MAIFIPFVFLLSFGAFHVIEGLANKWRESRFAMGVQATFDILKDKNLMEKIASSGGNPQEALKKMNSSERQKIQKYMKANTGSSTDDIRDKLTSMGITVDESMLARIAKFKGNPKAAIADLTPDEKKRIKSELDKSNIDPNSLKSQI